MASIALPTADRGRSYRFYRAIGMETPGELADDGVPEPLVVDVDGLMVVLIPVDGFEYVLNGRPTAASTASECILSLSLETPAGVDAWYRRALAAGAATIVAPEHRPWGYGAIVSDPDGHAWEVISPGA